MKYHSKIRFLKNPVIWFKDKWKTGFNHWELYFIASLPSIFLIIGLIANLVSLHAIKPDQLTLVLLWFLFIYGIINLIFLIIIQRTSVRLERERKTFNIIHKKVIEIFREYFTERTQFFKDGNPFTQDDIERNITKILEEFNNNFMSVYHRGEIAVTLKYKKGDFLYPIRVGKDAINRNMDCELINESYVYLALSETGKKLSYVYIKNLDKPDIYETEVLGKRIQDVKTRAKDHYKTFIALPIRSGKLPYSKHKKDFTSRPDLGMIGFDSMEKYGFGNLDKHEIDIFGCLADLLSEPVNDLIETKI